MQLESNFRLILNSSAFTDFAGIIPNLHSSTLSHLHSLPPSRSGVPRGPGLPKPLQRLRGLVRPVPTPGERMLAWSTGWDPGGSRPQGRAAFTERRRGKNVFVPKAGNLKQSLCWWIAYLFVQAVLQDQGEAHLCNASELSVLESTSIYKILLLLLASKVGFILQRCNLNKSEDDFKM